LRGPPFRPKLAEEKASMNNFANFLVPVAIGVVLVILVAGLWNMMRSGSPSRSQNLMRARVIAQFVAVIVAMGALWLKTR
jgi:ABC-type transport system involved in cytochrome c biogenesis permease subunit